MQFYLLRANIDKNAEISYLSIFKKCWDVNAQWNKNIYFCSSKCFICLFFLTFCDICIIDIVGWLDCPAAGQEINFIIPSKVPLGEAFNDLVLPGKRYSSRQVIHQQRVLGRKVSALYLMWLFSPLICFALWNALFLSFFWLVSAKIQT